MTADAVQELLYERPFMPFRIYMSNGRTVEVRHPETAIVTDQEVAVVAEEDGQRKLRLLSLTNINEIERLEASA